MTWQTHIRAQPESAPQLAAMLGVSLTTVYSWRCGRRAPPPTEQAAILRRLAEHRALSARVAQIVAEALKARLASDAGPALAARGGGVHVDPDVWLEAGFEVLGSTNPSLPDLGSKPAQQ